MSEQSPNADENPLDEFATELSAQLNSKPVEIDESSTDHIEGGQVWMKNSAARSIEASAVHLEESAAAFVQTHTLDIHKGAIGAVSTHDATLTGTTNSVLVANQVDAEDVRAVAIFALRLNGDAKTVFTPMVAFAAGAGFAAATFVLRRLAARLFSRNAKTG